MRTRTGTPSPFSKSPAASSTAKPGAPSVLYNAKWRLRDGTQVKRRLGPAWLSRTRTEDAWTRRRGRPEAEHLTEKDAIVAMDHLIREHARTVGSAHRPGRTFADVAEDWLRHGQRKRRLKRSTLADYRQALDAYLLPALGPIPVAEIGTDAIQRWHDSFTRSRTAEKSLMICSAVLNHAFKRGWVAETPLAASNVRRCATRAITTSTATRRSSS